MHAKKDPIEWWWNHGGETPELQSFAISLLSQVENLVYIHSSLNLLSCVELGYKEGPSAK